MFSSFYVCFLYHFYCLRFECIQCRAGDSKKEIRKLFNARSCIWTCSVVRCQQSRSAMIKLLTILCLISKSDKCHIIILLRIVDSLVWSLVRKDEKCWGKNFKVKIMRDDFYSREFCSCFGMYKVFFSSTTNMFVWTTMKTCCINFSILILLHWKSKQVQWNRL